MLRVVLGVFFCTLFLFIFTTTSFAYPVQYEFAIHGVGADGTGDDQKAYGEIRFREFVLNNDGTFSGTINHIVGQYIGPEAKADGTWNDNITFSYSAKYISSTGAISFEGWYNDGNGDVEIFNLSTSISPNIYFHTGSIRAYAGDVGGHGYDSVYDYGITRIDIVDPNDNSNIIEVEAGPGTPAGNSDIDTGELYGGDIIAEGTFDFTNDPLFNDYTVNDTTDGLPGQWTQSARLRITGNSPVPVPAAVWLLGSGLIGLVGLRKRIR